jgi:hypothetical protein
MWTGSGPTSAGHLVSAAYAPTPGAGPIYPVGLARGVLEVTPPGQHTDFTGVYGGQTVLWVSDPRDDGPVLIRGFQLDANNPLRFGRGPNPVPDMQLPPGSGTGVDPTSDSDMRTGLWIIRPTGPAASTH